MSESNATPSSAENTKACKDSKYNIDRRIELGLLFMLVIVGGVQVCIYRQQASIMQIQTDISAGQLAATKATQRAFINISELGHDYLRNRPDVVRITPIIKNTGISAARNVTVIVVNPMYAANIRSNFMPPNMKSFFDWKIV